MPSKIKRFIRGDDLSEIVNSDKGEKDENKVKAPSDLGEFDSYKTIPGFDAPLDKGLTEEQVKKRIEHGFANVNLAQNTRTTKEIIKSNVFTYFNLLFIILAVLLILVGSYKNLTFMGVIISNTFIGIVQELRSKRAVDKLSILAEAKVNCIRDGQWTTLPSSQLVRDDIVEFKSGDQICADAVVRQGEISVNESLLTGESDSIKKREGDELKSGSACTSGNCIGQLTRVGIESYASRLTTEAKSNVKVGKSEMMLSLDRLIKAIGLSIVPMGIALFIRQKLFLDMTIKETIQSTVGALLGMIPEGLYLLTSVALALSVIRLASRKVLVRDMNCVETLARVDTFCVDKTGTITEPGMDVRKLVTLDPDKFGEKKLREMLSAFYSNMDADNDTAQALCKAFKYYESKEKTSSWEVEKIIPFSSETKWSAITFKDEGTFMIGAPEFILRERAKEIEEYTVPWTKEGMRVLLVAHVPGAISDDDDNIHVDIKNISPEALICLTNRIRDKAAKTFGYFDSQGVDIKVISGDNPITVSRVATQAEIRGAEKYVDATTLKTDADIAEAVKEYTVFGRVTPQQKLSIVKRLKEQGHTVAMTGDGVNDVLALKEADCGIAMASGSQAASQISQLVLLNSDFKSMPSIVDEGRQVINNIQRSASLFLVKNIFSFLFAIISLFAGFQYPLQPNQLTIIGFLTIGAPAFLLSLQPNKERFSGRFLSNVIYRAMPGGLTDIILILGIELFVTTFHLPSDQLHTLSCLIMLTVGIIVLYYVCQPFDMYRKGVWWLFAVASVVSVSILPFTRFAGWVSLTPLEMPSMLILAVFMLLAFPTMKAMIKFTEKCKIVYTKRRLKRYEKKKQAMAA